MKSSLAIQKKMRALQQELASGRHFDLNFNYDPMPKQELLHANNKEILLYGGAVGGGKSAGLVVDASIYAMDHPKTAGALFRKTKASSLKVFLRDGFEKFVPHEFWNFNDRYDVIEFINGSVIFLYSLDKSSDRDKYQGEAWQYLGIDECTNFKKDDLDFLMTRCRSPERPDGSKPPRRIRLTANPGGASHAYIKRLFIDRDFRSNEKPELYDYIFSSLSDNKYLMADAGYRENMMGMSDKMRRRFLEGDWGIGDGVFLDQFDPRVTVVQPFIIPDHWTKYLAMDYGYADRTVFGWIAKSPAGIYYQYREATFQKTTAYDIAKKVKAMTGSEQITAIYGDPSIWQKRGIVQDATMASAGLIFRKHGLNILPGNNDRKLGGMMLREWLTPIEVPGNVEGDYVMRTKLRIFSSCKYTLETIPHLIIDQEDPDDIEHGRGKKQDDHAYDMLRYFVTSQIAAGDFYADEMFEDYENSIERSQRSDLELALARQISAELNKKSFGRTKLEHFLREQKNFDGVAESLYDKIIRHP